MAMSTEIKNNQYEQGSTQKEVSVMKEEAADVIEEEDGGVMVMDKDAEVHALSSALNCVDLAPRNQTPDYQAPTPSLSGISSAQESNDGASTPEDNLPPFPSIPFLTPQPDQSFLTELQDFTPDSEQVFWPSLLDRYSIHTQALHEREEQRTRLADHRERIRSRRARARQADRQQGRVQPRSRPGGIVRAREFRVPTMDEWLRSRRTDQTLSELSRMPDGGNGLAPVSDVVQSPRVEEQVRRRQGPEKDGTDEEDSENQVGDSQVLLRNSGHGCGL